MSDTHKALISILLFGSYPKPEVEAELFARKFIDSVGDLTSQGKRFLGANANGICVIPRCTDKITYTFLCENHYYYYRKGLTGEELINARATPTKEMAKVIEHIMRNCNERGYYIDVNDEEFDNELIYDGIDQGFLEYADKEETAITITPKSFSLPQFIEYPEGTEDPKFFEEEIEKSLADKKLEICSSAIRPKKFT